MITYMKVASPEIVKNGLVLWLDGHDYSNLVPSTTLRDRSGTGNNGTITSFSNTAASGNTLDEGIRFDGSNDIINCGNNATFNSRTVVH